jgi:hypothetical protein
MLRHFDPLGRLQESFDLTSIGGFNAGPLGISPDGVPHFSNGSAMYRLVAGEAQLVFEDELIVWVPAFDEDGNIYVPNATTSRLTLYGPDGSVLADPFAIGPVTPFVPAFGREADGTTNARLFVTDGDGALLEMNPDAVDAPGWPVGFSAASLALDDVTGELLGAADMLTADELEFLDGLGNNNGRFDVGDFRAYLLATGQIGGPATSITSLKRGRAVAGGSGESR